MKFLPSSSALLLLLLPHGSQSHRMSRHLVTDDLSMVILIAEPGAQATEGPFDGVLEDYVTSSDMTSAALAGSPGVSTDRLGVLQGVPLNLTLQMYAIAPETRTVGYDYEGVEVLLWHTDAGGVYSAVASAGTAGEKWLRGRQFTNQDGLVTFQTILAGPYPGRALHYHIRFRLPGETNFIATSQIVIRDSDWEKYKSVASYASGGTDNRFSSLSTDGIFNRMGDTFQDLLTLDFSGDFSTGVSAHLDFGLLTSDEALLQESSQSSPGTGSTTSPDTADDTASPPDTTSPGTQDTVPSPDTQDTTSATPKEPTSGDMAQDPIESFSALLVWILLRII